jgi:hypothetical protein
MAAQGQNGLPPLELFTLAAAEVQPIKAAQLVLVVLVAVVLAVSLIQTQMVLLALQTEAAVAVAHRLHPQKELEEMEAQALLSFAILAHNGAQVGPLLLAADTPYIHLLLQGHIQHEPFCKSK